MIEAKFICPECSAVIITTRPDVLLWEHCQACGSHRWDFCDLMMAEAVTSFAGRSHSKRRGVRAHTN